MKRITENALIKKLSAIEASGTNVECITVKFFRRVAPEEMTGRLQAFTSQLIDFGTGCAVDCEGFYTEKGILFFCLDDGRLFKTEDVSPLFREAFGNVSVSIKYGSDEISFKCKTRDGDQ
jgi:hypothetical protein